MSMQRRGLNATGKASKAAIEKAIGKEVNKAKKVCTFYSIVTAYYCDRASYRCIEYCCIPIVWLFPSGIYNY